MKHYDRLLLGLILVTALALRYGPRLILLPDVAREEGSIIQYAQGLARGDWSRFWNTPHIPFIGIVLLHWFTGFSINRITIFYNPLLGTINTLLVYYLLRDVVEADNPYIGTWLFAVLDSHIYRSSIVGSIGEQFGLVLLFMFVYVYHRKGLRYGVPILVMLPFTHIIVTGVAFFYVFTDQVILRKFSLKRLIVFTMAGLLIGLGFLYVLPYKFAVFGMIEQYTGLMNLETLYSITVNLYLKNLLLTLLGTTILTLVSVYYFIKKRERATYLYVYMGILFLGCPIFYILSSSHVSVYRLFIYLGSFGVLTISSLKHKYRNQFMLLVGLVMLLQVNMYGYNMVMAFDSAITREEVVMANWLIEYDDNTHSYHDVGWDHCGMQYLEYRMYQEATGIPREPVPQHSDVYPGHDVVDLEGDNQVNKLFVYPFTGMRYVVYSDRFSKRAYFRLLDEYNQYRYNNYIVYDIWKDNPDWKLIYDDVGGKIYESTRN